MIIVDIDGTMSLVGDRLKYLQQTPKDWDSFYAACGEDKQNKPIVDLVEMLSFADEIVFLTGRRESVREETEQWLEQNYYGNYRTLIMRKDDDRRHDTVAKPELLNENDIALEDIEFVIEDRSSMVKKWRELGLTCLQVADGDF